MAEALGDCRRSTPSDARDVAASRHVRATASRAAHRARHLRHRRRSRPGALGEILQALDRAGADVLEVGVPFSDPLADGPVIQRATERALAAGGDACAASLDARSPSVRADVAAPIVLFSYANPMLRMGARRVRARAAAARASTACWRSTCRSKRPASSATTARRRGHRYDLPAEPDDDRRADPAGGGARAAAFCTASRGSA